MANDPGNTQAIELPIEGMHCGACASRLQRSLENAVGVENVSVNFATEKARIAFDTKLIDRKTLIEVVDGAGFSVPNVATAEEAPPSFLQHWRVIVAALLTAPLLWEMVVHWFGVSTRIPVIVQFVLATLVQFGPGLGFYLGAYRAVRAGGANMDVLVALGTTAAYGFSTVQILALGTQDAANQLYFEASAVIITLVLLGKFLESRAKREANSAIRTLMAVRPSTVRVIRNDEELEIPLEDLSVGDRVMVLPGERIPADGMITKGSSDTDESLMTGESRPVEKQVGDPVIGGSLNGTGLLTITVTRVGKESTLGRIVEWVERAQHSKAPVERLVDRISRVFVPTVLAIAVVTVLGHLTVGSTVELALAAGISVLVIACPCALGLATPTAIVSGTGAGAMAGILIKDVETLETAHRIEAVVFDKTGTLTLGEPLIKSIVPNSGREPEPLLLAAAIAQRGNDHPLARAVAQHAEDQGLSIPLPDRLTNYPGMGVIANHDEQQIAVGSARLMEHLELATEGLLASARNFEHDGGTVIWVAIDAAIHGFLVASDQPRAEAVHAIRTLNRMGVETHLLSGDNSPVVARLAKDLGLGHAQGEVRPDQKAQTIEELRRTGRTVAMVGDGINDSPALAASDVGFAMGTGTDTAMETAGITLMRPDLRLVPAAIQLSRRTWRKIKQNLFWAFIYNLVGIPLAALGMLTPALAGLAMAASSVSVVANSLLLRHWRPTL